MKLKGRTMKGFATGASVLLLVLAFAGAALAQTLSVTLVKKGTTGALGGAPNIEVGRHDPTTGAFLESRTTDLNGVAAFGDIGSPRTTISILAPATIEDGRTVKRTFALLNVMTGSMTLRVDDEDAGEPVLATFNVALTGVPAGAGTSLILGRNNFEGGPTGQFTGITVGPGNLDASGRFGLVAEARDQADVLLCGVALDLTPATVNGTTVTVALNAAPIKIPFTTTPAQPVGVGHNVEFLRNGARIEGGHGHSGPVSFFSSGELTTCAVSGSQKVSISTVTAPAAIGKEVGRTFTTLPASVNFSLPDLSVDTLSRTGGTVNLAASGTAAADGTFVELEWVSGTNRFSWDVVADPSVTSVTLPALPPALADRTAVPASGVAVRVERFGLDSVTGFDALGAALTAANGDFDALIFNAAENFFVFRSLNVVVVDPLPTGGRITADVGGISCGTGGTGVCLADNILGGTTVSFTATAAAGFVFTGWTGEIGNRCGGPTPPNPCTFTLGAEGGIETISATFGPAPTLALSTNGATFRTGDSVIISVTVDNPGLAATVDFFFGALLPDGDTVVFFTDLAFNSGTGRLSSPATLRPIAQGVNLTTPFTFNQPGFFTYRWTGGEPPGSYVLFLAAVRTGALFDNRIDPADIVGIATTTVTFTP